MITQTSINVLLGLILPLIIGVANVYNVTGTWFTFALAFVYIVANVGLYLFYKREHADEFSVWKHVLVPAVGSLALIVVVYYSVNPLPATTTSTSFTVSWSGSDGAGSGIASYDVYVSQDGAPFTPFQTNTTATSASFTGAFGNTYAFFSVATSNVSLVQATPAGAQATTYLAGPPTSAVSPLPARTSSASFTINWSGSPGPAPTSTTRPSRMY